MGQLLENVKISKSSPQSVATCMAMGKLISKKAILVGNCAGFVGNRMLAPYSAEFRSMVENGAGIQECDDAAKAFGMPMGPATLGDLVGLELFWKKRQQLGDMQHEDKVSMGPYELTDWLCEKGRYGLKTPEEGYCQRPSDVDVCYIYGYGFPPAKGGPMFYAEKYVGLPTILEKLKAFDADAKLRPQNGQQKYRDYFVPSKLLEFCVQKQISSIQEGVELWRSEGPGSKMASKL